MQIKDLIREMTTAVDMGNVPVPVGMRRRKRRRAGTAMDVFEWQTKPVQFDDKKWQVKVGKKWITGQWRTVRGHRIFFRDGGGTLPKRPLSLGKKKSKIWAKIKGTVNRLRGKTKHKTQREELEMRSMRDIMRQIDEAAGKTANKNVVELIAADMVDAPKAQRRLERVLGADADLSGLMGVLTPVITHWLEGQGVKVTGATQATAAIRAMAKEAMEEEAAEMETDEPAEETLVLDDETLDEIAEAWLSENEEAFAEVWEWVEAPPEVLEALATDAAVAVVDELRGDGMIVANPLEQVVNALYMYFALQTAQTQEAYDAWAATLPEDEDEEDDAFDDEGSEEE